MYIFIVLYIEYTVHVYASMYMYGLYEFTCHKYYFIYAVDI